MGRQFGVPDSAPRPIICWERGRSFPDGCALLPPEAAPWNSLSPLLDLLDVAARDLSLLSSLCCIQYPALQIPTIVQMIFNANSDTLTTYLQHGNTMCRKHRRRRVCKTKDPEAFEDAMG